MKALHRRIFHSLATAAVILFAGHFLFAQDIAPQRTLPELKEETLKRVQEKPQRSMVEGILVEDARAGIGEYQDSGAG